MVVIGTSSSADHPRSYLTLLIPPLLLIYISYLLAFRIYRAFLGPLSSFPGPKANAISIFPWIVTTWQGKDNIDLTNLHQTYGKVVRIAPNQLSFIGDAQVWKDVHGFRKHDQLEVVKDRVFYGENINRTPGLITADMETHSRQRKTVSHAFSDKALKEQEPMLQMWAEKLRSKLAERAEQSLETDMLKMLNCTTFDVMGDLTFAEPLYMLDNSEYTPWVKTIFGGVKYGTRIRTFKMLGSFSKWLMDETMWRIPALRSKLLDHWKYTTDRVDRRLATTPPRPDLWTRILEKSENFTNLTLQEHYSIASLFMIAGTETTATLLSGATYHLLRNPTYVKRLQSELRASFTCVSDLKLEPLAQLTYLEAVLKESLRMYPPVPIGLPRVSPPGGMTVGEYFVPEGTVLGIHQLSTYRAPENFKYADQFRPERWLGDPEFADDKLDSLEPFSVGPRNCLGKNLAWHEMRLLLSTVMLHFDLELCPQSKNWADQKVYTLWEKHPLMCNLTEVVKGKSEDVNGAVIE